MLASFAETVEDDAGEETHQQVLIFFFFSTQDNRQHPYFFFKLISPCCGKVDVGYWFLKKKKNTEVIDAHFRVAFSLQLW